MECPACGQPNSAGARFCGGCAAPLRDSSACPDCGSANPARQRFCSACGQRLSAAAEAAPASGEPAAAGDQRPHAPARLAKKIRADRPPHETGAKAIEPRALALALELAHQLGDEEGRERELREAHRLFTEIGATGRAERLAAELATA